MRSAPTITTSTSPRLMRWPAMLSVMSVQGMPSCTSSHAVSYEMPGHGGGNEGAGVPFLHLFPRGEPRALELRAGFVGDPRIVFALGSPDAPERRAVAGRRERAGVARGHDARALADELR